MGDWSQVLICLLYGYTFITFDRLAFVFAILCDCNSMLQRKHNLKLDPSNKKNEPYLNHSYSYLCYRKSMNTWYNPNKSTQVPDIKPSRKFKSSNKSQFDISGLKIIENGTDMGGRTINYQILGGPVFEHLLHKYKSETDPAVVDNEDEFKRILFNLLAVLDSYHDWGGGGGRPYAISINELLKCLDITSSDQVKMLGVYNLITGKDLKKMDKISSSFEGSLINGIEGIVKSLINKVSYEKIVKDLGDGIIDTITQEINTGGDLSPYSSWLNKPTDTLIYPLSLQYQAYLINSFFNGSVNGSIWDNEYMIDAAQKNELFKLLHLEYGSKFMSGYYSNFDGASNKYTTTIQPESSTFFINQVSTNLKIQLDFREIEEQVKPGLDDMALLNSPGYSNMTMGKIYKLNESVATSVLCTGNVTSSTGQSLTGDHKGVLKKPKGKGGSTLRSFCELMHGQILGKGKISTFLKEMYK